MDYSGQEEDLLCFDANQELTSNLIPMVSHDSIAGSFFLDVWNDCPESAVERRRKFLAWMGVEEHRVRSENSVSVNNTELDYDVVRENQDCVGEISTSNQLSSSSSTSSLDLTDLSPTVDENVRECNGPTADTYSTMAPPCSKKGWLGRLWSRSTGGADDKKADSGRDQKVANKVKVKHYRKEVKELSAVYQCQDIKAHDGSILTMKFSSNGKYLASSGEDRAIRIWRVIQDRRSKQHDCPEKRESFEFKPVLTKNPRKISDSSRVVFPSNLFRITEKPLNEFNGHTGEILDISWSKNNYLLSASVDKTVRLWKIGCNNCLGVFSHNSYVTSVQFNPVNENCFISGSIDGKVRIWDISRCKVVDWADIRDVISAVCYRPDGRGGIIGSLTGSCRYFNVSEDYLEVDSPIRLTNKKWSSNKRIIGFKFLPQDPSKVLVVSTDSQIRILHGNIVVGKYKSHYKTSSSLMSMSLTSNGKHVVSASEDSNVYIWNIDNHEGLDPSRMKKIRSFERFSSNATVAETWCGFSDDESSTQILPFSSPSCLSLREAFVSGPSFKKCATWPEENLPASPLPASTNYDSQHRFLTNSYQSTTSSLAWGMVIVTGGWDGRIRTFQNYGLPVVT